jgi:predicted transcriptional regulator
LTTQRQEKFAMTSAATSAKATITTRPTSLKLPVDLKRQIDQAAGSAGMTPHAFMIQALAETTQRALLRDQFQQDALVALVAMQSDGTGYALDDVRGYFTRLQNHRKVGAPRPELPKLSKA